ncbi:MAG: hypothetical protein U0165_02490 [Polyangiaceae bacterium]
MALPRHAPGFDLERVEQVFQVNAIGAVRVYDAFADLLRKSTNGWLINIGSRQVLSPTFDWVQSPSTA